MITCGLCKKRIVGPYCRAVTPLLSHGLPPGTPMHNHCSEEAKAHAAAREHHEKWEKKNPYAEESDRMREAYRAMTPDERRELINSVLKLTEPGKLGMHGAAPPRCFDCGAYHAEGTCLWVKLIAAAGRAVGEVREHEQAALRWLAIETGQGMAGRVFAELLERAAARLDNDAVRTVAALRLMRWYEQDGYVQGFFGVRCRQCGFRWEPKGDPILMRCPECAFDGSPAGECAADDCDKPADGVRVSTGEDSIYCCEHEAEAAAKARRMRPMR